jgi:hypothetical protein
VLHTFHSPPEEGVVRSNEQEVEVQKEGRRRGIKPLPSTVRQLGCSLRVCLLGVDHDTGKPIHHCRLICWLAILLGSKLAIGVSNRGCLSFECYVLEVCDVVKRVETTVSTVLVLSLLLVVGGDFKNTCRAFADAVPKVATKES